ncbi:hypothetical protein ACSCB1_22915 [Streptomyces europaeiscabiei]|uniref:hypothetical protein n=1 Tax=Streptomyces europaeiscabiei TaxID=146819 RepID=UPI000B165956|nr:hypothetical protein [Streptomyces europaeiscabiei]
MRSQNARTGLVESPVLGDGHAGFGRRSGETHQRQRWQGAPGRPYDGAGYVTRFDVEAEFLRRYPVRQAGGETILELWVPAEELAEFNAHIVGGIEVVHEFR